MHFADWGPGRVLRSMNKGNQRERREYMTGFQGLSSQQLHLLRNDFALLLALLKPRLPPPQFRRCLEWQQEADRALLSGRLKAPRQPIEEARGELQDVFGQLERGQFSRAGFEQLCRRYRALFGFP